MTQSGQSPGGTAWEKIPFDNHRLNFSCRPAGAQHHIPIAILSWRRGYRHVAPLGLGLDRVRAESGFGRIEIREWKPHRIASRLAKSFHRRIVHC